MARWIRHPFIERKLLRLKTGKDWIIAKLVGLLLHWAKKLPPEKSTDIAERLGRFFAPILPRSGIAKRNMTAAFPEKSVAEIDELLRAMWGNLARTVAEYVFLDSIIDFDPENPDSGRVTIVGVEHFLKIRDSKKPTIIFTAHTGNWEILPIAAATFDLNVTALFRPPNNKFLAKRVLKARTTENGHLIPSRAGAAWALADVLQNNGVVGLLADQAFTRGPHIEFFNRTATANPIAAKLARQFECDIYPARCVRLPHGRFQIELLPKIEIPLAESGAPDIVETTTVINKIIEDWVREYPEQWLWLHDRWKIKTAQRSKWSK
ncbi:lipid A biosynthesis lauroyl acyltransferase [Ahrensia sp. AH-315-G08]|nr:lipid A biosynthesis lauroyl acyltransferase [Ahrensia sp. AH-315-G08]